MPKIITPPVALPPNASVELVQFQRSVLGALQSMTQQMNAAVFTKDTATEPLDMGHQRVTNVAQPSAEGDAVNLGFLRRAFKGGTPGGVRQAGGDQHYQIVYSTPGDITTGSNVCAAYDVGIDRDGTPLEANISAITAPTGTSIAVNFLRYRGTATDTLLSSDLVLPAGTSSMVVSSAFNGGMGLQYLDRVVLKVNRVGSTTPGSLVTVGLVVKRA